MKKLFILMFLAVASLTACDEESAGISRTTYFPTFVLEGETFYLIEEGEAFTDPGANVLEGGVEIPFTAIYAGRYTGYSGTTIGTDPDEYSLNYSAVNKDGFARTLTRTIAAVNTGDFATSISGAYASSSVRVTDEAYEDVLVMVFEVAPNVYEVSCALAGFYSDGRALGDDYLVTGLQITLTDLPNGGFTYESTVHRLIDDEAMTISDLDIDTTDKTISFHVSAPQFANGDWDIVLTQIQP